MLYITNDVYSCSIGAFLYKPFVLPLVPHYFKYCILYVIMYLYFICGNKWIRNKEVVTF